MYSSSAAAVAAVNSSNFDNAVWLCWSLLYSIFHFHIIPFGLGDASCMHSRTRIPAVTWLTLTQRTTCCRHGITHRSTASRYPAIQAAYSTTLTSQLKSSRQQCCSPSDHTTPCAALYTAHCSYDTQRNDTRWCNSGTCKRNNLRLRYSSGEEKIEDRDRDVGDLD